MNDQQIICIAASVVTGIIIASACDLLSDWRRLKRLRKQNKIPQDIHVSCMEAKNRNDLVEFHRLSAEYWSRSMEFDGE
jgi:uncharacterized membrane protein (DUF106 family)